MKKLSDQGSIFKNPATKRVYMVVFAIIFAFLVSTIFIAAWGTNPFSAYAAMVKGALFKKTGIFEILAKATPLTIMGLGISSGIRGGMQNLGGDGQFYMGAIAAVCIGIFMPQSTPAVVIWIIAVAVAIVAGGFWGGITGYLKARFNASEVIITIMMNYVALYIISWLCNGPLLAPGGIPQTKAIQPAYYLPKLAVGSRAHWGIVLGVILAVLVSWVFKKTVLGYRIEAIGISPPAAQYGGINVKRYMVLSMFISGAFCGLAGMIEVYGTYYRVLEGITVNFGFTALLIALLARLNPYGIILGSLFISFLTVGANSMQISMNVPTSIVSVIQSLIIIFILIMPGIEEHITARVLKRKVE